MAAETDGMLDTRTTTSIPTFDGGDPNRYSWRNKLEVYADLVDMDDHLEAVGQSFIMTKELDAVAMANQQKTSHLAHYHI